MEMKENLPTTSVILGNIYVINWWIAHWSIVINILEYYSQRRDCCIASLVREGQF